MWESNPLCVNAFTYPIIDEKNEYIPKMNFVNNKIWNELALKRYNKQRISFEKLEAYK